MPLVAIGVGEVIGAGVPVVTGAMHVFALMLQTNPFRQHTPVAHDAESELQDCAQ